MADEIAFPFAVDRNGSIARTTSDMDIARKYVISAVGTLPTERVMQPAYGCSTLDYLFDSSDEGTQGLLEAEVRRAVTELVPEVTLTEVGLAGGSDDGVLTISLAIQLNRTGETADVVTQIRTAYRFAGVVTEESI